MNALPSIVNEREICLSRKRIDDACSRMRRTEICTTHYIDEGLVYGKGVGKEKTNAPSRLEQLSLKRTMRACRRKALK